MKIKNKDQETRIRNSLENLKDNIRTIRDLCNGDSEVTKFLRDAEFNLLKASNNIKKSMEGVSSHPVKKDDKINKELVKTNGVKEEK